MAQEFDISIIGQHWLGSEPDLAVRDLCSHGGLRIIIGGVGIADETFDYGISNTALALLRTLTCNHNEARPVAGIGKGCPRLVFHGCGTIPMIGCPIGIDWNVEHLPGDRVRISDVRRYDQTSEVPTVTFAGLVTEVEEAVYRTVVIRFAQEVKLFFANQVKTVADDFDRQQYEEYWREFNRLLDGCGAGE